MQRTPTFTILSFLMLFPVLSLAQKGGGSIDKGDQKQTKSPPQDLYFYSGVDGYTKIPLTVDTSKVVVKFSGEKSRTYNPSRAWNVNIPGISVQSLQNAAAKTPPGSYAFVDVDSGMSADDILNLTQLIIGNSNFSYAGFVYQHSPGEFFGETTDIIVDFRDDLPNIVIQDLITASQLEVVRVFSGDPRTYILRLPENAVQNSLDAANMFIEQFGANYINFAHPDFAVQRQTRFTPNDPLYTNQWHLNSVGQNGAKVDADVDAPEAWDISRGDSSVVIAFIDEGFDLTHEDLTYVTGWDALYNDNNPTAGSGEYHGTAVAGIGTAKGNNSKGLSGICPNCLAMPIRLIVAGTTVSDEAESFDFAWQNGADIISNSWGYGSTNVTLPSSTRAAMDRAVQSGRDGKGCIILFAAGNSNESMDGDQYASYSGAIAVAASTDQDLRAYYSEYGNNLDVCAPSNGGNTSGTWTTDITGSSGYSSTNYTGDFGGTSSACPLAAGVAGLMLSVNSNLTYTEVRQTMIDTADVIDQAGGQWSNGFSRYYGYGKVNAFAAVQAASNGGGGGGGGTTQTYTATDVPKNIPDNNSTGVTSSMAVPDSGPIQSVNATINITHTYIGDLVVTLFHPDGTSSILHNRSGGNANDIAQTYAVTNFNGKDLNGTWQLKVQDLAGQDVGTLNAWSLQINFIDNGGGGGGGDTTEIFTSTNVPLSVPDNNSTGVSSSLNITQTGTITGLKCSVNISHTWIGDLVVSLIHPDGTTAVLHNRTGGSADNIVTTFDIGSLNNKFMNGTWKLKVQDLAQYDAGTINSWSLTITYSSGGGGGGNPQEWIFDSTDTPINIPDNNSTGITSSRSATSITGSVIEVNVSVQITHTYKGDLVVSVRSPRGKEVILHSRSGGSANDINTTYDTLTAPVGSLAIFNGDDPNGTWQLKVQDLANLDVGALTHWQLQVITQ